MPRLHFASTRDPDMFYLVRRTIADPFFFLETSGEQFVYLNALEIDAFNEQNTHANLQAIALDELYKRAKEEKVDAPYLSKMALALCKLHGIERQAIAVSNHFPLDLADFLRSQNITLAVQSHFLPERRKKSAEEIAHIKSAVERTESAFTLIEQILRESKITKNSLIYQTQILTSEFLKEKVELLLFENGLESPDGMIISCGIHAAMPHHSGSGPIRPHQTIVCDIFPRDRESGYFADVSRTFVKGTPSKKVIEMYEAVKKAQTQAAAAVRSGVEASAIHAIAAEAIQDVGFDVGEKGFIHSLGHGVGLEVHEAPHVGPNSKDTLQEGDVITIEPGLYYPEHGGVRLEDVLIVTKNGHENLCDYPRNFIVE